MPKIYRVFSLGCAFLATLLLPCLAGAQTTIANPAQIVFHDTSSTGSTVQVELESFAGTLIPFIDTSAVNWSSALVTVPSSGNMSVGYGSTLTKPGGTFYLTGANLTASYVTLYCASGAVTMNVSGTSDNSVGIGNGVFASGLAPTATSPLKMAQGEVWQYSTSTRQFSRISFTGGSGGGSSGNVAITSPLDGSGYVNVDVKSGGLTGGTVTANQGTAAALASAWPTIITQGGNAVASGNPLYVQGTFWQATQPVSLASAVAVTGTFWQTTQPVSGTVTTNQGTAAALSSAWPTIINQGGSAVGSGNPLYVQGSFYQATQPVSIASSVPVTGTFYQATQPVSLSGTVAVSSSTLALDSSIQSVLTQDTLIYNTLGSLVTQAEAVLIAGNQTNGTQGIGALAVGGDTLWPSTVTAITTATTVKSSAGSLYSIDITNLSTSTGYYLEFFNTTSVTLGTTAPVYVIPIPFSTNVPNGVLKTLTIPHAFSTAISVACVTAIGGSTAAPASTVYAYIGYK